jgi:hypothetical protein
MNDRKIGKEELGKDDGFIFFSGIFLSSFFCQGIGFR